ncbi:MAG: hypothetical protein K5675_03530 [Lachnospiraceae bacterium]|nr:hypothetical protein [Lachnospiraceae bacterium]
MKKNYSIKLDNVESVISGIKHKQEMGAKAVNSTIGDFVKRGPGWVSQEVTGIYSIKKKDITQSQKGKKNGGKVRVYATTIEGVKLEYKGRPLTPTHFKMKPTSRPKKGYRVSMEVKKGQRKNLPADVFLASAGGEKALPFQRKGPSRLPIEVKKTVSVPQMITNAEVSDNIYKRINEELEKRLDHHITRYAKK